MPSLSTVSRLSLKNILVPADFSPASRAALFFAQAPAQAYGSTVLLVHAIPPEPHHPLPTDGVPEEEAAVWLEARLKLDAFQRDSDLAGLSSATLLDRGAVRDVIPAMIEEHKVDLLVLGTHGRRGVKKIILGSEAEKIYRAAMCPVLVVGPKVQPAQGWKLHQILCPIDTSGDTALVLHYALSPAEKHPFKFILMQVIPLVPWQHQADIEERSRRVLEALILEQSTDWCSPEYVVRWEYPPEAILHEAQKCNVDLIVLSVHHSRLASALLPWPTASQVIGQAHCPVLTIRV